MPHGVSIQPSLLFALFFFGGIGILAFAVKIVRKFMNSGESGSSDPAFTLQDLRQMRDQGLISLDEYEKMRAGILGAAGVKAVPPPQTGASAVKMENDESA